MDTFFRSSEKTATSTKSFKPSQSSIRPAFDGYNESDPTHDSFSQDLSQIFSALDDEGHDLSMFDDENFFDMSSGGSPKRQRPDQLDMNLIFNRTVHFIFNHICIFDFRVKYILLHCFRLPRICWSSPCQICLREIQTWNSHRKAWLPPVCWTLHTIHAKMWKTRCLLNETWGEVFQLL